MNVVIAEHQARMKRRDLQLSKMLALQVIITIICALPLALSQLTTTMTLTWTKTALNSAIENFFAQLGRNLAFLNCSISFYLYTLSGTQFRLECRQMFNRFAMILFRKRCLDQRRIGVNCELTPGNVQDSVARTRQNVDNNGLVIESATNRT